MATYKRLLLFFCGLSMLSLCDSQGTGSVGFQKSKGKKAKQTGIVFTVKKSGDDNIHILQLLFYPGYENVPDRSLYVPGWQFNSQNLDFLHVALDYNDRNLFLFERLSGVIYVLTGYNAPVKTNIDGFVYALHVGNSNGKVQLAYDWMSKTLYFVDSALQTIQAINTNMTKFESEDFDSYNLVRTVVKGDLQHPEGLAVDPLMGYLFFSDNGGTPKIERSLLDGSRRITLPIRDIGIPMSLACDVQEKKIYWADTLKGTVDYANYDGSNKQYVRTFHASLLSDLAIFRDLLVVVDENEGESHFINKTSGEPLWSTVLFRSDYLHGVAIYNNETQPMRPLSGPDCAQLNCHHLCITTPTNPKCMCYDGYMLNTTSNKCEVQHPGFVNALVVATQFEICLADLRALNVLDSSFYPLNCIFSTLIQDEVSSTTTTTTTTPTTTTAPPTNDTFTTNTPEPTSPTPPPYNPLNDPANYIKMFDLDILKRCVYFVAQDNSIYKRPIGRVRNDTYRELVASSEPNGNIAGIVFDWVNGNNLYWMDSKTHKIYRKDLQGLGAISSFDLPIGQQETPMHLVMMYRRRRFAFWVEEDNGQVYKLMSVNINGQDSMTHVYNREKVRDLVVDDEKSQLFWLERNQIYNLNYDKSLESNVTIDKSILDIVYSDYELLLAYKNYLVWAFPTYLFGTYLETHQFDANLPGTAGYFDFFKDFVDWKVLDSSLTPRDISGSNPCSAANGGCEQICVSSFNGQGTSVATCSCGLGYTLHTDGKRCTSTYREDNFVLVEDDTNARIYQINLDNNEIHALDLKENAVVNSVFYDKQQHRVVFSEGGSENVYAAMLNETSAKIIDDRAVYQPGSFALDETTGHLYYADNFWPIDGYIRVLTRQGVGFRFLEDELDYEDYKSAVDVHPQLGYLFVGVTSNYRPSYVLRMNLDGTDPHRVYLNTVVDIKFPTLIGMVIDHTHNHVYWTEHTEEKIFKCNLEFTSCEEFYSAKGQDIRHIATDGEYVYYTSRQNKHVNRISMTTKQVTMIGRDLKLGKLETLSVYRSSSPNTQAVNEACRDRDGRGNCSTICFPTATGRRCECEGNITLKADNRTCENVFQCDQSFAASVGSGVSVFVGFECLRYVNETCEYYCSGLYSPSQGISRQLKCTETGWDRENESGLCQSTICPSRIPSGRITGNCNYAPGASCNFICDDGYYKNPAVSTVACLTSRAWASPSGTPCINAYCPMTIPNGKVDRFCDRRVSSTCNYTCDTYHSKSTTITTVSCSGQSDTVASWSQTNGLCTAITCPSTVAYGNIINCQRRVNDLCEFTCANPASKNQNVTRVLCLPTANWNQSLYLCGAPIPSVTSASTGSETSSATIGLGIVVALLALVIILIVVLAFLFRRRLGICERGGSNLPPAKFTNEHIDGIENPGYGNSAISVTNDMYDNRSLRSEGAYSTISERSTKPIKDQEQLPDKKEIESPTSKTDTYVSADDWLKQQDNPDYKY